MPAAWQAMGFFSPPVVFVTTARKDALKAIYSSENSEAVFNLLHRYKVRYVFVGALEKRDFGSSAFPLRANFRRAFSSGEAAVFEILK